MACLLSRPAMATQGADCVTPSALMFADRASAIGIERPSSPTIPLAHTRPNAASPGLGTRAVSQVRSHRSWQRQIGALVLAHLLLPVPGHADNLVHDGVPPPKHKWNAFVQVAGQPEPVPAEWVSTPEGQFAHSIVIPNPVPKDSGYRWWWSSKQYFLHLCETEAGEFVFKSVDNVEGFLFMRPPKRPTDFDLKDRYKLEAPSFERTFQSVRDDIRSRGTDFVSPGRHFLYIEEPNSSRPGEGSEYLKASEYDSKKFMLARVEDYKVAASQYAVTWRGIRRSEDRAHGIAGTEVIVLDRQSGEIMAVWREFGLTGSRRIFGDHVWWLNAAICPQFYVKYGRPELQQWYGFISAVLHPRSLADGRR
ncbi:MAG: hypothetical protein ABI794_03160 [Betaproteobacteria bacterium]